MRRDRNRRRPGVELLEPMRLLSGLAGLAHQVASPPAAHGVPVSGPIALNGVTKGMYHTVRRAGAAVAVTGEGRISPLGHSSVKGSLELPGQYRQPAGTLIVTTARGKVDLQMTYLYQLGTLFHQEYSYEITGGTRHWMGASGTGRALVTSFSSRSGTHGSLRIDWNNG